MNANLLNYQLPTLSPRKSVQGFNLIELMIVLVILSVLSSLFIPQLLAMVTKARETEIKQEIATLIRAQNRYYMENGAFLKITKKQMQGNNHDLEVKINNPKYNVRTTLATNYNAVRVKASAIGDYRKEFRNYTAGLHYSGATSVSVFCQTYDPNGDIVSLVNFTLRSSDQPGAECNSEKGQEIK